MTIGTNPTLAVGPAVAACQLTCQNGGYCAYTPSDDGATLFRIFSSGGMLQRCVCPPGYTGLNCENLAEQCHDLKCSNGTPCSLVDGQYACDCSEADAVSSFAGDMCRKPATSYCGQGDLQSRSFCTNGGLCKASLSAPSGELSDNEYPTHGGCHCAPEFEGRHCEYLRGMTTDTPNEIDLEDLPTNIEARTLTMPITPTQSNRNSDAFSSVAIILSITLLTFGFALLAQRHRRLRRYDDLSLDRSCYKDDTPIRVKIIGELEILEHGNGDGYIDDEDLQSISECSLEEIELEDNGIAANYLSYLKHVLEGGYISYFDAEEEEIVFSNEGS